MTTYLRVKNWQKHQHYQSKENPPPWIKLKRAILTDYGIRALAEADRFKLIALWLLASDKDGTIPDDAKYVASCLGVKRIDLDLFIAAGFLERVSRQNLEPVYTQQSRKAGDTSAEQTRNGSGERTAAIEALLSAISNKDETTGAMLAAFKLPAAAYRTALEDVQVKHLENPAAYVRTILTRMASDGQYAVREAS